MTDTRKYLIEHLRGLSQGTHTPASKGLGLCFDLTNLIRCGKITIEDRGLALDAMLNWPNATGDWEYPVPHPTEPPAIAFVEFPNLWGDDEYGDNRRELCAWIADRLDQ